MELRIGQVLSNTFGMVKQRFGGLLGVFVTFFAIQILLMLVLFGAVGAQFAAWGTGAFDGGSAAPLAAGIGVFILMFVVYFAYFVLSFASQIGMTHQASPLLQPDVGSSIKAGFRSILTALGLVLIFIVGYFIVGIALAIVIAILSVMGDSGAILGAIIAGLLLVYLVCRLILTMPIIAVEGERNPINAITRSWTLTSGNALKIFLAVLVFAAIMLVLGLIFTTLIGGGMMAAVATAEAADGGLAAMSGGIILSLLIFLVVGAIAAMISSSFMSALHAGLSPTASVSATFE